MTVKECAQGWLEEVKSGGRKRQTYLKYKRIAEQRLFPEMGETEVAAWSTEKLSAYIARQQNGGSRQGGKLSASSVNQIAAVINGIFEYAARRGEINSSARILPARKKKRTGDIDVFDTAEQKKLEREIVRWRVHNYRCEGYRIALYTGLRIGELIALKWSDIDFTGGKIFVAREVYYTGDETGQYRLYFDTPKTESSRRMIPLSHKLKTLLRGLQKERPGSEYVLEGKGGGPANINAFRVSFAALQRRAGVRVRNFHVLRHTYATRLLEAGADFKTVSELLGHESPVVTMRIYGHTLMSTKRAYVNRLDKLFQSG